MDKSCKNCGKLIPPTKPPKSKFCNPKCRCAYRNNQNRGEITEEYFDPSKGTKGAISEAIVSIDLCRNGFEVFTAFSPSSSCDLIAMKEGKVFRIEVRSGYLSNKGTLCFYRKPKDKSRSDCYAIVIQDDEIIYDPSIY